MAPWNSNRWNTGLSWTIGPDTEVLARAKSLDIASASHGGGGAVSAAQRGAAPRGRAGPRAAAGFQPAALVSPPDRRQADPARYVEAVAEPAIEAVVAMFALDDHKRRQLAVNPRR